MDVRTGRVQYAVLADLVKSKGVDAALYAWTQARVIEKKVLTAMGDSEDSRPTTRVRRGKVVTIPEHWRGKTVSAQQIRDRKKSAAARKNNSAVLGDHVNRKVDKRKVRVTPEDE